MGKILDLAGNTFRETIRDRVLNVALVFALVMIAAGVALGTLSIGQDLKIVKDLGLAAIEFFGVAIAVFVGTSMLYREIDKRTIFIVLAKPVRRHEFMLGKFLGLSMTLTCLLAAMTAAFCALLVVLHAFDPALLWQVALVWLQVLLLVALALLFSTFASPVMAMIDCFALYVAGHNLAGLEVLARQASPALKAAITALYYVLPNLGHLDIKNQVVYGAPFSLAQWAVAAAYGLAYAGFALAVAVALFSRKEF